MKGPFFIVLACFLWALDTLIRYPLLSKGFSAGSIVFFEHLILSLFLAPTLLRNRKIFWESKVSTIFYLVMIGVLGSALGTLAFTSAFGLINPSFVILIQKWQPLVAILMARILLGEKIGNKFLFLAALCFLGSLLVAHEHLPAFKDWLLALGGLIEDHYITPKEVKGWALAGVAVIAWGSSTVFGKKLAMEGFSPKNLMAFRFFFGLLGVIPVLIFSGEWNRELLSSEIHFYVKIVAMALLSGILAMSLYYRGLERVPARLSALLEMSFPFMAVIINWAVLNRPLDSLQLVGGGLLLGSATIIQLKKY